MAGNPVRYAEDTLGVHAQHGAVNGWLVELEAANRAVAALHAAKRTLADDMLVMEATLVNDERAANPEMSQAAFDRHIKTVFALDGKYSTLRAGLITMQNEIDLAENRVREIEFHLKAGIARLEELSGLLRFYAAAKEQRNTTIPTTP